MENSYLDSVGTIDKAAFIGLKDEYMKIDINLSAKSLSSIWRMPVETISLSEAGFERVYQSSCVLLIWDIPVEREVDLVINQKVGSF